MAGNNPGKRGKNSAREKEKSPKGKALQLQLPFWKEKFFLLSAAIVMILSFIAMSPALKNEFVDWDDPEYVRDQPLIQSAKSENFRKLIETPIMGNYHPLTMYSLALDYKELKGGNTPDPAPFHRTNIVLHVLNSFLVFLFIFLLSGRRLAVAAFTGLVFGVHPMHVESVAWISERKDVLYTFFFVAGLITYWYYIEKKSILFLALTFVLFFLSCFSKPSAVIFPVVMLLVDYFRKRNLTDLKLLLEKVPFFAVAVWGGLLTLKAQGQAGAMDVMQAFSVLDRSFFACNGVMMYLAKAIVPAKLSGIYPYPQPGKSLGELVYAAPAVIVLLAGLVWWFFRNNRAVIFGIGFFIVNLLLVLQFVAVGSAMYADRYTYVPYIGLFFAGAIFLDQRIRKGKKFGPIGKMESIAAGSLLVLVFVVISFQRSQTWKDSPTFWTDVIGKYPRQAPLAYNNLGKWYRERNQYDKAIENYQLGIEAAPGYYLSYNNMGTAYFYKNMPDKALPYYDKAIELNPDYVDSWFNRGAVKAQLKDNEGALSDLNTAVKLDPNSVVAYKNRSLVLLNLEKHDESIKDALQVLEFQPGNADMMNHVGVSYQYKGDHDNAIAWFGKAIAGNSQQPQYLINRAISHKAKGNLELALADALAAKRMGAKIPEDYLRSLGG